MMGGLSLRCGSNVVTHFKSRKVAALLAYLAFYASRRHNREELQALLWPDDSLDAARNSLRVALSLLRRQLATSDTAVESILYADRSAVWLDAEHVTTDTAEFDSMYAAALHNEDEAGQAALLTNLVDAYRGELLTGLYEDWVLTERARLNESYMQALRKLVRVLAASHEYQLALEYARRAVHVDPLREEAARDLMRLFLAVHQPSAAMQHYKELEQRLNESIGTRPAAATRELARRIAEGSDREVIHPSAPPISASATSQRNPPPPIVSSPASGGRIPIPAARFFGREHELTKLQGWVSTILESNDVPERVVAPRLLTLTGPGGTGKTRLAMQTTERLAELQRDRTWYVPLADLTSAGQIADALADALQIPRSDISALPSLMAVRLNNRPSLIILDNMEHLLEGGAPLVRMLLEQVRTVSFMITSRRRMGLPGEREFPVPPLPVPAAAEEEQAPSHDSRGTLQPKFRDRSNSPAALTALAESAAVQLFVDRAQAVESSFSLTSNNAAAVSSLCRHLEGLPLALELAAARIRVLTPDQMLTYVARRLDLLVDPSADKDGRHRSLRAATEWSYRLLSPDERRLFLRLSIFEGGWTLAAAGSVCEEPDILEAVEQLRMNSLIQTDVKGVEVRFRMLETLRSFACEQLSAEEAASVRRRHAEYFLMMAEEAEPHVKGPDEAIWMDALQVEHDNLRAALNWFVSDSAGGEPGLRLVCALWRFWIGRGYLIEGRERFDAAMAHPGAGDVTVHRARALLYSGDLANSLSDFASAESLFELSLAAFRTLGNRPGAANALSRLGLVKMRAGSYAISRQIQEESLALHEDNFDNEGIATSSSYLGLLAIQEGDYHLARICNERCLAIYRNLGNRRNLAMTLGNLGLIAAHLGEYASARGLQEESLAIHRELGIQQGIAAALSNLSIILIKLGEHSAGRKRLLEGMALFRELGSKHSAVISLDTLGGLAIAEEEWPHAAWLYGVADGAREALGAVLAPRDKQQHDRDISVLREQMGDEAFYLEFTKGQATSMEQALEIVLSESAIHP